MENLQEEIEELGQVLPQMDDVARKLGVKFVIPYMHLNSAHKGLMVVEADRAEAVRDFLVQAGFFHILDNEFYLLTPIVDLMKQMDKIPAASP